MSWLSPVTRFTFTPDPSSSSYRVTVGPTVMPESLATTPNSASVASSTLPPSSTKRRSISCFVPRLSTLAGGSFHEPGRYPGPRSIATCPRASTVVRAGGSAWTTSSGGLGSAELEQLTHGRGHPARSRRDRVEDAPHRDARREQEPEQPDADENDARTDDAGDGRERRGHGGAEQTAGVAQPVRRVDRRAPTGEVEEPDDGQHHEHDPQTDAQRRRR